MKAVIIAVLLSALALGGCQISGTSAQGWGQIATGVGQVIGSTPADQKIADASARFARYCVLLQTAATVGIPFMPARQQLAARQAQAALDTICASPPRDVQQALRLAADAYAAVVAVRDGTTVAAVQGGK